MKILPATLVLSLAHVATAGAESVTVTGAVSPESSDSFWTTPDDPTLPVEVGTDAAGTVVAADGAVLSSKSLLISSTAAGSGTVTLTGEGTRWTTDEFVNVGHENFGTLRIESGAALNAGHLLGIDLLSRGSGGSIVMDSGTINAIEMDADALDLAGTGIINLNNLFGEGYGIAFYDFDGSDTFTHLLTNDRGDALTLNLTANENFQLTHNTIVRGGADLTIGGGWLGQVDTTPATSALVTGPGTRLALTGDLDIGRVHDGSLSVENEARVEIAQRLRVSSNGGTGLVSLDDGTLETAELEADITDFTGTGTVRTSGVIGTGFDFLFDGGSTGTMTVTNGGADDLLFELDGSAITRTNASLRLINGAEVNVDTLELGSNPGDLAVVRLDGQTTALNLGQPLKLGRSAEATLSIGQGAVVNAPEINLAQFSQGHGILEMRGGTLNCSGVADIGVQGTASVSLAEGARFDSGLTRLGVEAGSAVEVLLHGQGTEWSCDSMGLGFAAPVKFTLRDGAKMTTSGTFSVGAMGDFTLFLSGNEVLNTGTSGQSLPNMFMNGDFLMIAERGLPEGSYSPLQVNGVSGNYSGSAELDIFGMVRDFFTSRMDVPAVIADPGDLTGADLSGQRLSYDGGNLTVLMHGQAGTGDLSVVPLALVHAGGRKVLRSYGINSDVTRDAMLRVFTGTGEDPEELQILKRADEGSSWETFNPAFLDYQDGYLTFRTDGYVQYAVTTGFSPIEEFRSAYGLDPDGSDDDLDWSGNGVANLLYFAFGLGAPNDPHVNRSRLPTLSKGNEADTITLSFVRPIANDTGLGIEVLTSTDLSNWSTPDALGLDHLPLSEQTEDLGDGHQRVTRTYTSMPEEPARFYRVTAREISTLD